MVGARAPRVREKISKLPLLLSHSENHASFLTREKNRQHWFRLSSTARAGFPRGDARRLLKTGTRVGRGARWRSLRCTSRWCSPRGSCGRTVENRCVRLRKPFPLPASPHILVFGLTTCLSSPTTVNYFSLFAAACALGLWRCRGGCHLTLLRPPSLSSTKRTHAQVHLCGSFTNWLETVPMAPEPTPTGAQVFAVVCNLPPGYHQYKFIVDGEWRHDENQAFIQDPLGNVNNWCVPYALTSFPTSNAPHPPRSPSSPLSRVKPSLGFSLSSPPPKKKPRHPRRMNT